MEITQDAKTYVLRDIDHHGRQLLVDVSDLIAAGIGLTSEAFGAYARLVLFCRWRLETVPDDDVVLARLCSLTTARWKKIRPQIARLLTAGPQGLWPRHATPAAPLVTAIEGGRS